MGVGAAPRAMAQALSSSPRGILAADVSMRDPQIHWSPKGRRLLMDEGVVALDGSPIAPELLRSSRKARFAGCDWSPDGERIVASRVRVGERRVQEIVVTSVRKFAPKVLVGRDFGEVNIGPAWEPGGHHVCFLSFLDRFDGLNHPFARQRLCVTNLRTRETRVLIERGVLSAIPLWAPEGKDVLVSVLSNPLDTSSAPRTYILDVRTGRKTEVKLRGHFDHEAEAAAWVPGTRSLVFTAALFDGAFHSELVLWSATTGRLTTLVTGRDRDFAPELLQPTVSPDGKRVVYIRNRADDRNELVLLTLASRRSSTLYSVPAGTFLRNPAWSPDGKSLAFWQERYSEGKLYLLQIDQPGKAKLLG